MARVQAQQAPASADAEPAKQAKGATPEEQAGFQEQSLNELGVDPAKRKAGAPSARDQSRGEMGDAVQRRSKGDDGADQARAGVAGSGQAMPHADKIQASFGKHDVSGVRAQVGGDAAEASDAIGAEAYAVGDRVGFASQPDLHTAAHEAAHVAQQRGGKAGGSGVGAADDAHEREADQVADAVVAGQSAEPLLDNAAGTPSAAPAEVNAGLVQRKTPKDQDAGFTPEFQGWDEGSANIGLGEVYAHQIRVTNEKSAPKGTKYHWDHKVSGPSAQPVNKPEKPKYDGPSTFYPFQLRAPGTYNVASKLHYGVGKDQHESDRNLKIIVDRIMKEETEVVTEKDGKKRPFAGSMLVGEDLVITSTMNDLRKADWDALESVRAHAQVPGLEFKGAKALAHGIYEIRLHASQIGRAAGIVAALPFDSKLGDTPLHPISVDIQQADDDKNPDARPVDFSKSKEWLKSDYDMMFREMHTANQAFTMQSQVNDPPPKQSIWVNILLGAVTAAFGGLAAGVALGVAKKLIHAAADNIAAEAIQEGVKSFMEQGIVAAATATFSKGEAQADYPHVAFFKFMESAINKKQRDMEQLTFSNVVQPQLDEAEKKKAGAGFSEAMRLDRAMKQEVPNVGKKQTDESFEHWVKFVTKAQLGTVGKEDPDNPLAGETGTDMGKINNENWNGKRPDTAGVIQIDLGYSNVFDPKTPVVFGTARMPGMNQKLRERMTQYKVKDLPFATRVHGEAPGRYGGGYTFSRNEQGMYWLSKGDHEYLAKKGGGLAEDGAKKILEQEIGETQMPVPEG